MMSSRIVFFLGEQIDVAFGFAMLAVDAPADRLEPARVHAQVENIEPVVVPRDVVHLARLYAAIEVDVGVDDSLPVDERLADDAAVRPDEAGEGAALAREKRPRVCDGLRH